MAHTQHRPGASDKCIAVNLPTVRPCLEDGHESQLLWAGSFSNAMRDWARLADYCNQAETAHRNGASAVTCMTPKLLGCFLRELNLNLGVWEGGMSGQGATSADRGLDPSRESHATLRQRDESYGTYIDQANLLRDLDVARATSKFSWPASIVFRSIRHFLCKLWGWQKVTVVSVMMGRGMAA